MSEAPCERAKLVSVCREVREWVAGKQTSVVSLGNIASVLGYALDGTRAHSEYMREPRTRKKR